MAPGTPAPIPGWDRIATPALVATARAVASEALRASRQEVRARVNDDGRGGLAVTITAPLVIPRLGTGATPDEPVLERGHRARHVIADRLRQITGRAIVRVDLDFATSTLLRERRVR